MSYSFSLKYYSSIMDLFVHLVMVFICAIGAVVALAESPQMRVVGGHEAVPYSHPHIVSVQRRILGFRAHDCGGALLNKYWVLTAASCVEDQALMGLIPIDVVAGLHVIGELDPLTQISTVEQNVPHPLYNKENYENDIALIKVRSPFVFSKRVKPIKLPVNSKIKSDVPLILAGWGNQESFIATFPNKLQEMETRCIPYQECVKAFGAAENETSLLDEYIYFGKMHKILKRDMHMCTGPMTGGIGPCDGDAGSPLVQFPSRKSKKKPKKSSSAEEDDDDSESETRRQARGEPVIIGVAVAFPSPCELAGVPKVYTRVSYYIDFIKQYIKE